MKRSKAMGWTPPSLLSASKCQTDMINVSDEPAEEPSQVGRGLQPRS
jgi:hypothetical protein